MPGPAARVVKQLRSRLPEVSAYGATLAAVPAGLLGWWPVVAVLLVASVPGELRLRQPSDNDPLERVLRIGGINGAARLLVRFLAVIALGVTGGERAGGGVVVVLVAGVFLALHAVAQVAVYRVRVRRLLVVETRNVDLTALDVPPPPPRWLMDQVTTIAVAASLPVLVAASLGAPDAVDVALGLAGALALLVVAAQAVVLDRRTSGRFEPDDALSLVQQMLQDHRPEVLLYFSDAEASVYQVDMWLPTVERLDRPAVVILRSRSALAAMGPTSLPVLCVPSAVPLLALDFDDARVALFVANNGPNIHVLRLPHVRSAFVGHGDSDKNASINPFAKVYDELWTAGPAGRERWQRADVGVDLDAVVEVGRPQLDFLTEVDAPDAADDHVPTVLYAPTWEGWNDSQEYGSVAFQGVALVRAVLESPAPLRLIYKPHPLTGRRDPRVREAHRRIVALVRKANAARTSSTRAVYTAPDVDPLHEVDDATERAVRSGTPLMQVSAVDAETRTRAAGRAYLRQLDPAAHLVVEGPGPDLFAYFEAADYLVTDVSSVLTDFQATGRPYATCNTTALGVEEFLEMAPSARGGVVVSPDGEGIAEVVAVASGRAPDARADDRRRLREHLLGDVSLPAQERFARAVDALAARGAHVPPPS